MIRKIIYTMLVSFILFGCNDRNEDNTKTYAIDVELSIDYEFNEIFDLSDIIPLETTKESIIGRTHKVIFQNGQIFIWDKLQKSILVFEMNGKFTNKLHSIGRGPGEYLNIEDFTINPFTNNIEIVDGNTLKTFNKAGGYVRSIDVTNNSIRAINKIDVIDSMNIAFISIFRDKEALIFSREKKEIIYEECIFPKWAREKMPFGSSSYFSRSDTELLYLQAYSNKFYSVSKEGYKLSFILDFNKYNFNYDEPGIVKDFQNFSSLGDALQNRDYYTSKYIVQFQNTIQNDSYLVTNFLFKNKPTTLLYNKENKKYILIKGKLSKLLFFNRANFYGNDTVLIMIDANKLKLAPRDWFTEEENRIINGLIISDNPVVLKLKLNTDKLQTGINSRL